MTAIEAYVANGRDAFLRERMIQDAVIRNFEVIGEAAGRLSDAARQGDGVSVGKNHCIPQSADTRILER